MDIEITENEIKSTCKPTNDMEKSFVDSFDDKTRIAYQIAMDHLETSFSLRKCIAFQSYKKKNKQ